jgi:hypothetical protein
MTRRNQRDPQLSAVECRHMLGGDSAVFETGSLPAHCKRRGSCGIS